MFFYRFKDCNSIKHHKRIKDIGIFLLNLQELTFQHSFFICRHVRRKARCVHQALVSDRRVPEEVAHLVHHRQAPRLETCTEPGYHATLADHLVQQERTSAADRFRRARQVTDGVQRQAILEGIAADLQSLLGRYPESTQLDQVQSNLRSVRSALR